MAVLRKSAFIFIIVSVDSIFLASSLGDDPSQWPGHLEPLGAKSPKLSLETLLSFPSPVDFFTNYVSKLQPVLIKGGAKGSPGFSKWSDEYFISRPESSEFQIFAEQGKKENRTNAGEDVSFGEFVKTYKEKDIYMVHGVPPFLQKDVLLPHSLVCEEVVENMLVDTVMWFSSGGTKSVLHNDDVDNINCLFSGNKVLLFIDYKKYKSKVTIDHPNGGYSGVDIDRVDFTKYPGLHEVQYYNVSMETGDCLYIPYKWYHQVRSYDRNIAINVWWTHKASYVPKNCEMTKDGPYTLDKFNFSASTAQSGSEQQEGPEDLVDHFSGFLEENAKEKINFETFRQKMEGDSVLMGGGKYQWNDQFTEVAKGMFEALDVDKDEVFSSKDLNKIHNSTEVRKVLENLAAKIEDLVEDQNEPNLSEDGGKSDTHSVWKNEL